MKKGQPLVKFNINKIKAAGYDFTTMLILTNMDEIEEVSNYLY
ncbi:PTS glucose transporter subunit IIA [Clostridium sp. CM028]|nr:PTS glucose transporter subunit IIA [Clostridium sp. CM028]